MDSGRLEKLEELAGRRADKSRHSLELEQQKLQQLEHHSNELRSINQEYQQAPVGNSDVAPQQLAQRRAFVERLTEKLEELAEQREQKRQSVSAKAYEHQQHTAQHTAIEIVNTHRLEQASVIAQQRDQQQLDEIARGLHFEQNRKDVEKGNE